MPPKKPNAERYRSGKVLDCKVKSKERQKQYRHRLHDRYLEALRNRNAEDLSECLRLPMIEYLEALRNRNAEDLCRLQEALQELTDLASSAGGSSLERRPVWVWVCTQDETQILEFGNPAKRSRVRSMRKPLSVFSVPGSPPTHFGGPHGGPFLRLEYTRIYLSGD